MICKFCDKETYDKMKDIPCCKECRVNIYKKRDEMVEKKKELFEARYRVDGTLNEGPLKEYLMAYDGTIKTTMMLILKEK